MLSFFEMLGLLEAKKSTVKEPAVEPNATVEPAVEPKPQYSKENPHPEAGTIRSHNSGRVVNGKWMDYTPEELEKMKEPSKPSREVDPLVQSQVDQRSEKELAKQQEKKAADIAELQRTENLKKYQQAWERFTNLVLNARKKQKV